MPRVEQRRASEEFGGKRKRRTPGRRETSWQRTSRRAGNVFRYGRKVHRRHRGKTGAVLFLVSCAGIAASMVAFQGAVQLVTIGACGAGMVGGYVLDRRAHAKSAQSTRRVSFADRRRYATNRAAGRAFDDDDPSSTRVRVRSHTRDGDGVGTHTRARPGAHGTAAKRADRWGTEVDDEGGTA